MIMLIEDLYIASVIVWDESTMIGLNIMGVFDRFLRVLMENDLLVGGKIFILLGDWCQTLPIVPKEGQAQVTKIILKKISWWPQLQVFR